MPDITNLVTKVTLYLQVMEIEKKIPHTPHFVNIQEFSRLTKISFDARTKEVEKKSCK